MTTIIWDPAPQAVLEILDSVTRQRILKKLDKDVRGNVLYYVEHLEGRKEGKLRIGDYRLFVDYLQDCDELRIRAMWHRKNAYK